MKCFAYVGSKRGKKSRSFEVVNSLFDELEREAPIDKMIVSENDINILPCEGCCNCFFKGGCHLDNKDDMSEVKKKMLEADIIIIASPVYFHHISGSTKKFIDRISYWSHIFKLIGKLGVGISISSTNGNEFVDFYLEKTISYMGGIMIDSLSLPFDLLNKSDISSKIKECSDKIVNGYKNIEELKPTQKQEYLFKSFKQIYEINQSNSAEGRYWRANNYFEMTSFSDLFMNTINKKFKE